MFYKLFLGFTLIPLAELYLLITIGSYIGVLPTIAIVLSTGIAGAWLARLEGLRTFANVQNSLAQGQMPAEAMMDAVLILIAGILLLTPGFLTDITGILLLIPWSRTLLKRWMRRQFDKMISKGQVTIIRPPY